MLRALNRNISSTKQPKKLDNLELCTLVDRCTQILRDDRIQLRALVKEYQNQKLIDILQKYKRRSSLDDLSELQIELRKFMNELKGRCVQASPERDFVKKKKIQKENLFNSPPQPQQKLESHQSDRKVSNVSQVSEKSQGSIKKRSFVSLQRNVDHFEQPASESEHIQKSENTPVKGEEQLQFMTIVSQSPHQVSSIIQEGKDTESKDMTNRSQVVLLKYNVEEINAFRDKEQPLTERTEQRVEDFYSNNPYSLETACSACTTCKRPFEINQELVLTSQLPNLQSLNYRNLSSSEYKHLFTDWNALLGPKEHIRYQACEQTPSNLGWTGSNEISQVCESYKVAFKTEQDLNKESYLPNSWNPDQRRHYEYTIYA